jgi:hypothetical protein
MRMSEKKLVIAKWIARCNEVTEEIEFLLDKAYPDGAEDRFYADWETVLDALLEEQDRVRIDYIN